VLVPDRDRTAYGDGALRFALDRPAHVFVCRDARLGAAAATAPNAGAGGAGAAARRDAAAGAAARSSPAWRPGATAPEWLAARGFDGPLGGGAPRARLRSSCGAQFVVYARRCEPGEVGRARVV